MDLRECEKSIGYEFKNKKLLEEALTHTSFAYENKYVPIGTPAAFALG